jgi:hypothetical protein
MASVVSQSPSSIYDGYEKKENGSFRDSELVNDSVQRTIMEEAKAGTKYTIKMAFKKKPSSKVSASSAMKKVNTKETKETKETKGIEKATKTFEEMMTRFEQMVQMNQMIQMNQMSQLQMMSHLMELKASVVETRQDLGYKLKELNQKVDFISTAAPASTIIRSTAGSGRSSTKKSPQQLADSIAATLGEMDEPGEDLSHLTPLHKESGHSISKLREIDDDYVKSLIKAKTTTSFVKVFDYLYKSQEKMKRDLYPIRVIKAKTFQYLDREGNWILDTNGTKLIDIICSNIEMLLTKINNQFFEEEEFDVNDFMDNQAFISLLDESKIRTQILNHIRDGVVNHGIINSTKKS